jgi:hypothetical protein
LEPINFTNFLDINNFISRSILNDTGISAGSTGVLRLNRFVGVLNIKKIKSLFKEDGHNNELEEWGNDFLSWNIFKINCPAFKLDCETKEMDSIPRHYFKTWTYDELEVSFLESSDMKIRHYFYEWMQSALHSHTFVRRYYDEIKADWFIIYPLNAQGVAERYEIFENLVPIEISSMDYDVSDEGTAVVLTKVKFKYIGHEVLSFNEGNYPKDKIKDTRFNRPDLNPPTN